MDQSASVTRRRAAEPAATLALTANRTSAANDEATITLPALSTGRAGSWPANHADTTTTTTAKPGTLANTRPRASRRRTNCPRAATAIGTAPTTTTKADRANTADIDPRVSEMRSWLRLAAAKGAS